jgi:hypothetical protein
MTKSATRSFADELGIDDNATSTAITIDSNENVTIGADDQLNMSGSHNEGGALIHLKGTDTPAAGKNLGGLNFGNSTDASLAMIRGLSTASDAADMLFFTEPSGGSIEERMRIDSSGRVLVGITGASGFASLESNDIAITGQCILARGSGSVLVGTTTAGSAGAGDIVVAGGVYLGGTGTANKLDDYEEGTWTPAYTSGSSGYSNQVGKYTKIGEQVTAYFYLQMNNNQVGGSTLHVGGLPFTCNSDPSYGGASGIHCNSWSTSVRKPDNGLVAPNNTVIDLYHSQGTTATTQPVGNDIGNGSLIGCVVYRTSS